MEAARKPWVAVILLVGLWACLLTLRASPASADTIGFDLGAPNSAIAPFPGPYVHVDINRTASTSATITFSSLTQSGNTYLMGDGSAVALNVNAGTFSFALVAGSDPNFLKSTTGTQNVDGFGNFNFTIDNKDGFPQAVSSISFVLTDTSGTWGSASNVLVSNSMGFSAASHIFVQNTSCTGACATGFAANGAVPEPGTLALVGSGLVSVGVMVRKQIFHGRQESV